MRTPETDRIARWWSEDGGMGNVRSSADYSDAGCRMLAEHAFADVNYLLSLLAEAVAP